MEELDRHTRPWEIVWPRFVAMYLCRELLLAPYATIGRAFGFDHGTVMNACNRVRDEVRNYPRIKQRVDCLFHSLPKQLLAPTANCPQLTNS